MSIDPMKNKRFYGFTALNLIFYVTFPPIWYIIACFVIQG